MSDERKEPLPPGLRTRLEQEPPAERETLERVWRLLKEHQPAGPAPDADDTWAVLKQRLGEDEHPPRRYGSEERRSRPARHVRRIAAPWKMAVAAVLLVALIGGGLLWSQPVQVTAPAGERMTAQLPDGSTVELSGGTMLTYPRGFQLFPLIPAGQRAATVRGEAFFAVAEQERPFFAETFNTRIEVVGTEFSVQAWPDDPTPETRVTLASGRVRVAATAEPDYPVTLDEAGQHSRVVGTTAAPTPPESVAIDQVLIWREEGFFAADQPLSVILTRLENRYGVPLTLQAPAVAGDSMTLFYAQQVDIETILRDISRAKGLKYRSTSRGYELVQDSDDGEWGVSP